MDKKDLAGYLDFANHRQDATPEEIVELCAKVKGYGFHSIFVNACYLDLARKTLGSGVVGTVVSFPLGQDLREVKVQAALGAVRKGADELDVSMNVGFFKAGKESWVLEEMKEIVARVKDAKPRALVKFIIETGLLTQGEIKKASELVVRSKADFIKTSSGFGPRGASLEDVDLIREAVGGQIKIKAAGGVNTYERAVAFIERGADRIGTSHAPEIVGVEEEVKKSLK